MADPRPTNLNNDAATGLQPPTSSSGIRPRASATAQDLDDLGHEAGDDTVLVVGSRLYAGRGLSDGQTSRPKPSPQTSPTTGASGGNSATTTTRRNSK
jgi:hypothetical protein